MLIRISRAALASAIERVAASPRSEVCGLLLGRDDVIIEARETLNVADDPARRFEVPPACLIAAHRQAREGGLQVMGHYHSHPEGDVRPSRCDAEMAARDNGTLWLICAPGGSYAMWRTIAGGLHGRFVPCELELVNISPLAS